MDGPLFFWRGDEKGLQGVKGQNKLFADTTCIKNVMQQLKEIAIRGS